MLENIYEIKRPLDIMSSYFSEKRGLKNIYEKLCLKYSKNPRSIQYTKYEQF